MKIWKKTIGCMLLVGMFASCTNSEMPFDDNSAGKGNLTLALDKDFFAANNESRAGGEQLAEADFLLFKQSESGERTFLKNVYINKFYTSDKGETYQYSLTLGQEADGCVVLCVGNAHATVTGLNLKVGDRWEEVTKKLTYEVRNVVAEGGRIPLFGQTKEVFEWSSADYEARSIFLVRPLVRYDIAVNGDFTTVNGLEYFKLKEVVVKGVPAKGMIVPDGGNFEFTGQGYDINKPTTCSDVQDKVEYGVVMSTPGKLLENKLFLPEMEVSAPENGQGDVPYMLIGGYYGKDNNSKLSWYKVALFDDKNGLPYLRNSRYLLNISKVNAEGVATKEEAEKGGFENVKTDLILPKAETAGMRHFRYNANKVLAASRMNINMTADAGAELEVYTDVETGWNIEGMPQWLKLSQTSGGAKVRGKITLTLAEGQVVPEVPAVLKLTAGLMDMELTVSVSRSNSEKYLYAVAQQVVGAQELGLDAAKFQPGNGIGVYEDYLFIPNCHYSISGGKFVERQSLIVYNWKTRSVVKTIEQWTGPDQSTLNFEGNTSYPEYIDDIAVNAEKKQIYVMRRHSCIDVFSIENPQNPTYVTRIGQSMGTGHSQYLLRNSSCVGASDKYLLVRTTSVINTYTYESLISASWSKVMCKTSTNEIMPNSGYRNRQFVYDETGGNWWLTEAGQTDKNGCYKLGLDNISRFGNKYWQKYDPMVKNEGGGFLPLDFAPTGMMFTKDYVLFTDESGRLRAKPRSWLTGPLSRNGGHENYETRVEGYVPKKLLKFFKAEQPVAPTDAEIATAWTIDTEAKKIVKVTIGLGEISYE